ncbi:MAG: beta-lactamase family protein [Butyrivibrio sp.]|nr:beta-lactamase family protein [Acetatifactor muris]MCM1559732.1 beta-lactamase family protein [Butyrivibrio sp.]
MYQYKETMDRLIGQEVESGRVKGAAALVLHRGREIYSSAFGFADAERGYPMMRDTIIRLYSMSKPVTAVAAMILAERGEIDLWDPVSKYLPCFQGQKVWEDGRGEIPAKREVTIYDLLNMTSGITYPDEATEPGRRMGAVVEKLVAARERGERVDTRACMEKIASVPLVFQPGERWMYGFSADVLGGVVEAASGRTFGEFLGREIFEPLDMRDTGFFVPKEKRERFAQAYEQTEAGLIPHKGAHLGEYYGEDVAFESGGAGLVSTLDDYAHFASMLVQGGTYNGKHILGRKTVDFMTGNHLTKQQAACLDWDSLRGYGYGCLMRVLTDAGAAGSNGSPGEFGWDGWTGNYVTMDRKEDLVLLYFIQLCGAGTTPLVRKLRMVTYGALE